MTAVVNPPRHILSLTVGVTGHRGIGVAETASLRERFVTLFRQITAAVEAIAAADPSLFADCPPALALASPLADGADQLAAEVALEAGWALHAMLPFQRDDYARDFDEAGRARLESLLARAASVWTPPGGRSVAGGGSGYVVAGEATVAYADLLVAAWDGRAARGPGGTAEVVEHALDRGLPVVHLALGAPIPDALLWSGFEELRSAALRRSAPRRPLDEAMLGAVLGRLLAPPPPPQADALRLFLAEHERLNRVRPEWPLLLALTGVQRLRRGAFRARRYADAVQADWAPYRRAATDICGPGAAADALESAFAWADGLAQHYAHVYRSGMVLNFIGAAVAVMLSLASWLMPGSKALLVALELSVIGAVIANTAHGTRRQWHRRWLDYRFLAEQLRPLRSLKLIGAASPPFRVRAADQLWTDWYALGIWRAMGPPPPVGGRDGMRALAHHIATHELDGQVAYHASVAHRMHVLDHRLHQAGLALLVATIAIGATLLVGLLAHFHAFKPAVPVLAALSAALPTLGGAIFGIRGAGDFAGTSGRSAESARRMAATAALLRRDDLDYPSAVRAVEEASEIMLADLSEWRTSYAYRKLAVPS